MRQLRQPFFRLGMVALVLLTLTRSELAAEPPAAFRQGLVAIDQGDWQRAAEQFRAALAEDPFESDQRVFVSGVFSHPYLPHFYLGWSLYRGEPRQCEAALTELEISHQQGVVRRFRRQLENLQEARTACNSTLLPAAAALAARALDQADSRASDLATPLADSPLEQDRLAALDELQAARLAFGRGQSESRLRDYREAERLALDTSRQFDDISQQLAAAESDSLATARGVAERQIVLAERAKQQLSDLLAEPRWQQARSQLPELGSQTEANQELTAARQQLSTANNVDQFTAAARSATVATSGFDQARQETQQRFDNWRADGDPPLTLEIQTPQPEVSTAPQATLPSANTEPAPGLGEVLGQLTEARQLVDQLDDIDGELIGTLRDRIRQLITEVSGGQATDFLQLGQRLTKVSAALRLTAAADSYLGGHPTRCLELLEGHPLGTSKWAAEGHLLIAAARFALHRRGGESDAELLRAAIEEIRLGRALAADLEPLEQAFPPAFRELFAATVATEANAQKR